MQITRTFILVLSRGNQIFAHFLLIRSYFETYDIYTHQILYSVELYSVEIKLQLLFLSDEPISIISFWTVSWSLVFE